MLRGQSTNVEKRRIPISLPRGKLIHQARELLVRLAKRHGVTLRQSYARVGKHVLIAYHRYAHANQLRRANRALRSVRTYLGRVLSYARRGAPPSRPFLLAWLAALWRVFIIVREVSGVA